MGDSRVAIITGGTGALGRVLVRTMSETETRIYVPVRSLDRFREIFDTSSSKNSEYKLRKIFAFECDAEKEDHVKMFVDDVVKLEGRIDYLINTIGGLHNKMNVAEFKSEVLNEMLSLNFLSAFYFCRHVLPHMVDRKFGRIVAVGARAALETTAGKFAYAVSKRAVIELILSIAEENKDNNITANVVVPVIIDTESNRRSMPNADFSNWTSSEEIVSAILYLLSDNSRTVSGNVVRMFGKA